MKGIVLAGGTATRLYPLTIVTNKHLLPIYDRPMIYYPIETLAGMGIREVMVIVGGKSVGDVVELLADGSAFGIDLTYRYQPGALGIAHAIGLARDFVGDDAFCCVLGDNILRGPALADVAADFEAGPFGAGTLLYQVPDPERFGVAELDADGRVVGFEEKPDEPKSDLIPIGVYFLRPDAFEVIDHLAAVRPRRARDHRRAQPLHPRAAASSARSTTATGPTPGRCRRCCAPPSWPRPTMPPAACRRRSAGRWAEPCPRRRRFGRLLVTGGAGFIGSCYVRDVLGRRDGTRITVLDKLTYAGNEANLAPVRDDPEMAARLRVRARRHRRRGRRRAARRRRPTPSSTSPPSRTSTARSSTPRRSWRPASSASTSCSRRAARPRTGRASSRSRPTRSTARSTRATPARTRRSRHARRTRRPRRPASCSSGATSSPMASMPS